MKNLLKIIVVVFIALFLSSNCSIGKKINFINYDNTPPDPPYIQGPTSCNITEKVDYYITISDPDGHRLIELYVEFGDGTNETLKKRGTGCTKGWRSGYTLTVSHIWKKSDDYTIKAKVKDYAWDWSDWGTLDVHVSKTKSKFDNLALQDFIILRLTNLLIKQPYQLIFSNIFSTYL